MITKNSFIILFLGFVININAQNANNDSNNPCFNIDRLHTKINHQIKKETLRYHMERLLIKIGFLGKNLQKRQRFIEKFSRLSPEEQKAKIEKWLKKDSRRQNLEKCSRYITLMKANKLEEESIDDLQTWAHAATTNLKDEFLCFSCGAIFDEETADTTNSK